MKRFTYSTIVAMLLVATGSMFYACKKEKMDNETIPNPKNYNYIIDPSQDNGAYWGFVHNLFLTNFNEVFDENNQAVVDPQTPDEVVDYIYSINENYLNTLVAENVIDIDDVSLWQQALSEESKYYACIPYLYYTIESNVIEDQLNLLEAAGYIDALEHTTLNDITNSVMQNLAGTTTHSDFLLCIENANMVYAENYGETNEYGKMLQIVLSIANASAEYWSGRPDLLDPYLVWEDEDPSLIIPNTPCYAVPAPVAADVGGAIVGGAVSAGVSYVFDGEVDWKRVGINATATAICGSTGIPPKAGKAFVKGAMKVGKWLISKL